MRFSVPLAGAFAALATAQTNTVPVDPAQTSAAACLKACPLGDVNCQSHCITVPSPNQDQANATTKCAAKCPQGDGSPGDTQKFADCVQSCISTIFYASSDGTPEATKAAGSGSDSGPGSSAGAGAGAATTPAGSSPTDSTGAQATESGSDSGSGSGSTGGSGGMSTMTKGSSGTGTATGSASASTSSGAAAGLMVSSGALFGGLAAIFAL